MYVTLFNNFMLSCIDTKLSIQMSNGEGLEFTMLDLLLQKEDNEVPEDKNFSPIRSKFKRDLLCDLNFMTLMWRTEEILNPIVLYFGNGNISHFSVLAELYPNVTFQIYSNRYISHPRIKCNHSDVRNNDLDRWTNRSDILLICDLDRSKNENNIEENDKLKSLDLKTMVSWWRKIAPSSCSILFNCPISHDFGRHYSVPYGTFMLEPFGNKYSSRTRLLIGNITDKTGKENGRTSSHPDLNVDISNYMKRIEYHNRFVRSKLIFSNFNDLFIGDNYYDDSYELYSYIEYFKKINQSINTTAVLNMKLHIEKEKRKISHQKYFDDEKYISKDKDDCELGNEPGYFVDGVCLRRIENNVGITFLDKRVSKNKLETGNDRHRMDEKYRNIRNDEITGRIIVS